MQKWEYLFADGDDTGVYMVNGNTKEIALGEQRPSTTSFLSEKGDEGWELVGVAARNTHRQTFYFKRPQK